MGWFSSDRTIREYAAGNLDIGAAGASGRDGKARRLSLARAARGEAPVRSSARHGDPFARARPASRGRRAALVRARLSRREPATLTAIDRRGWSTPLRAARAGFFEAGRRAGPDRLPRLRASDGWRSWDSTIPIAFGAGPRRDRRLPAASRARISGSESGWARIADHACRAWPAPRFAVWAPNARAGQPWSATSTPGTVAATRCASAVDMRRVGDLRARRRPAERYKYEIARRRWQACCR
jgi:hypothetical protein